eukprot:512461_1
MFRKDRADRAITNLKTYFQLINNENSNINKKQYTSKLTLTKLSEYIKEIYQLLYGKIDKDPKQEYICKLIPKLINQTDNLFYKLCLYRTYFSYETQTYISKILKFIIESGSKYGNFSVSKYIKDQYNPHNKHNKIIDALLNNFNQHSGGMFSVLQEMTKRSDLTSMFLKLKIKSPAVNIGKHTQYNTKIYTKHHKSYSQNTAQIDTMQFKHYKNYSDPAIIIPHHKQIIDTDCKHDSIDDISFVKGLFILVKCPSLHISLDAFKTLKYLFSYTKKNNKQEQNAKLTAYFYDNYNFLFTELNSLINSENAIHKRKCFLLLTDILTVENNFDILLKYITRKENLLISKRILTDNFIISHHDSNNHNVIIDTLLEDYFEDAGHILMDIASRPTLSNLLLNNTFITRLEQDEKIDINDIKNSCSDIKVSSVSNTSAKGSHKNLSNFFGVGSQTRLPHLNNMDSDASYVSEEWSIMSPGNSTMRNRYSGEDMPCFKRSPVHLNHCMNRYDNECMVERSFVMELIYLIDASCSDLVATYSFEVLKLLLSVNKKCAARYLEENYLQLIKKFRELIKIENGNKMRQKEFLRLLCDLLCERTNLKFRKKFMSECIHLKIIMNLLKCQCDPVKYYAFNIFSIFVNSNVKNREIHIILWRNRQQNNLVEFIKKLLPNYNVENFIAEKKIVIEELNKLPTPKSDKSYRKIPIGALSV